MNTSNNLAIIQNLQRTIETLHNTPLGFDIDMYLVDDTIKNQLPGAIADLPEQLFIRQSTEAVDVSLYISPQVLTQLGKDNPYEHLHAGNLAAYCIALEGVSHFVLLAARARADRQISALEMEIQAEVDKFIAAWLLLAQQGIDFADASLSLHTQLFARYTLHASLPASEIERYHVASRVASRYCYWLAKKHQKPHQIKDILHNARMFARKSLADKMAIDLL